MDEEEISQSELIAQEVYSQLTPEEKVIKKFNQKYAVVHTSTYQILVEKGDRIVLDSRQSLINFHENNYFINSDRKSINKAKFWLKHPECRKYIDLVFDPCRPGNHEDKYNIFKGFAVTPVKGACSLFWDHVRENICSTDESYYRYVRKWMANVIQRPKIRGTALVLRGLQGTGKNIFVDSFGKIFGKYYIQLNNLEQIVGKFNAHLQNAYLIFANEAIWGGHKKEVGALKALITDDRIFIEAKGKDGFQIDNCRQLIVCSNEEWAVPMDMDDRRFFCLNVSSARKEDHAYFGAIIEELENGGYEALLFDLLQEDLSGFNPRIMPQNDQGFDMKLKGSGAAMRFIYAALFHGAWNLACSESVWMFDQVIATERLFNFYKDWCLEQGVKQEEQSTLGRALKKLLPSLSRERESAGQRKYNYHFANLENCRKEFQKNSKSSERIWDDECLS